MSRFTGTLIIEELKPGILWKIKEPIVFEVDEKGSGKIIEVPAEFITDGTSIPIFLRAFLAVWGTYGRAAALHDYLYALLRSGKTHQYMITRKDADNIFLDGMSALGTTKWLKLLLWSSVRLFGWYSVKYGKNK